MPTKSNNLGGAGGKRSGAGRKKGIKANAKPKQLDIPEIEGVEMPKPDALLSGKQYLGGLLSAKKIYEETWEWLKKKGCAENVNKDTLERYAMSTARWKQAEKMISSYGFLSKHPTTGNPIQSPYVTISIQFMNQSIRLWDEILQRVNEGGSSSTVEDDPMTKLFNSL